MNLTQAKTFFLLFLSLGTGTSALAVDTKIKESPYVRDVNADELQAVRQISCDGETTGTGVHIGMGFILWAGHMRAQCANPTWNGKATTAYECQSAFDYCVSRLVRAQDREAAGAHFSLSLRPPYVGQRLRVVGYPSNASFLGSPAVSTTGPVLGPIKMKWKTPQGQWIQWANVWKVGVSSGYGSSNSPGVEVGTRTMYILINHSRFDNSAFPRSKIDLDEARRDPSLAPGGIEASAIARSLMGTPMRNLMCQSGNSIYVCKNPNR